MTDDDAGRERAQYDEFAGEYAAHTENNLFNAHYERPEMLRLAGDVDGLRVLDAGCGAGPLAAALRARGADVAAFDLSPAMVELARRRLGAGADVRVGDLSAPLPYDDAVFDLAVVSLALHYVEDWAAPLAELRRVLVPGGRLLVSIIHPIVYAVVHPEADYFARTRYSEEYLLGERTIWLTYWHRPLQQVLTSFADAGLRIARVTEPPPAPGTPAELLPSDDGRPFISFLFLELEVPAA